MINKLQVPIDTRATSIILTVFCLLMGVFSFAQKNPSLSGTWNYAISNNDISEAGNDFGGTYESAANQLIFNMNKITGNVNNWSVSVKKSDILWNSKLKLWIKRTGDGRGKHNSTISNGANYQEIQNTSIQFFNGYNQVDEIPLQLKITGVSVTIPVNSYYTLIIFTVTEN